MNTWSGIIMVALLHITSFKPHNDGYESYFTDKKAEAQKVKYVCDITNLLSQDLFINKWRRTNLLNDHQGTFNKSLGHQDEIPFFYMVEEGLSWKEA